MCLEDIRIGKRTNDNTISRQNDQIVSQFSTSENLTIPSNTSRVGLRLTGLVHCFLPGGEINPGGAYGWVEVWVENVEDGSGPVNEGQRLLLILTSQNPTQLIRVETEGTVVQRRLVMRPMLRDEQVTQDNWCTLSYTEYVNPELIMRAG